MVLRNHDQGLIEETGKAAGNTSVVVLPFVSTALACLVRRHSHVACTPVIDKRLNGEANIRCGWLDIGECTK